ncbi:MAG TPA: MaoC family dehydratase N-terminal domain-containing protein [Acidimicrobiales bacterium]|jgi:acyl dehydratase|nr:MaoC family dehydratase N-terminal domain-containing protein [Acidimicrobiales bacterium]
MEERGEVRAVGTTEVDDYLSVAYAHLLALGHPLYIDAKAARAAGYRNVLVPEGQLFLATRVGEADAPREAVGLPEGFGSVVTGLSTDFVKPVEAGQPFTVRVRRLPAPAPPSAKVKEFHQLEYELTDIDGEVAVRQRLTVAEFRT